MQSRTIVGAVEGENRILRLANGAHRLYIVSPPMRNDLHDAKGLQSYIYREFTIERVHQWWVHHIVDARHTTATKARVSMKTIERYISDKERLNPNTKCRIPHKLTFSITEVILSQIVILTLILTTTIRMTQIRRRIQKRMQCLILT